MTAVGWLTVVSMSLGAVGVGFTLPGFLAPTLIHLQRKEKRPEAKPPGVHSGKCLTVSRAGCSPA